MNTQCPPLITILQQVTDCRSPHGLRHPLPAILALACAAIMCGYRSYSAMAEWGRHYGDQLIKALGFTRESSPCAATFYNVFSRLDLSVLETKLAQWAEGVMTVPEADENPSIEAIAIDGKTLRGTQKHTATICHLLSAVSHRLGMTLFQHAVPLETNEISTIISVLEAIVLKGRVITVDALLTQSKVAKTILKCGGDYVMPLKANQPNLLADVALVFDHPAGVADTINTYQVTDLSHGRIETRRLSTSTALTDYSDWPGLKQVFRIEREVIFKKTGETRHSVVYGITSLSPVSASPKQLLEIVTAHWTIENQSHWVRDVTFDEDRSQVRAGNVPQVMAALRNTAIGLMRTAGFGNIAAATRHFAAQPIQALALIGIQLNN